MYNGVKCILIKIEMKNYNKCKRIQLIMIHLTGFRDSENIIIRNGIPYFVYTGSSYKDKLKNGLSLEHVFEQEDIIPIVYEEVMKEVESDNSKENLDFVDYEEKYEFYEEKEKGDLARKGKWIVFKKRESRNTKKNSIKINGYNDKLFNNDQNLPDLFDDHRCDMYDDFRDDNSIPFYSYYDWHDYYFS